MKFTIAIPAYKTAFLLECIESILEQSFKSYELIIVNDNSPEDIESIVTQFSSEKIRYYKNEKNTGAENVVDNWNKCLSLANGEYFTLMGDDDKMDPNYLQEFNDLIEKYQECRIFHCRSLVIDEKSNAIHYTEPRPEFETVYDSILSRLKGHRIFFVSDHVYHTQHLKEKGGFYKLPLAWGSDDISSYIAAIESGIAHTNKPVFMYRRHSHSISTTGDTYIKMDAIIAMEKWLTSFSSKTVSNKQDKILNDSIKSELKLSISKTKLRTIYMSKESIVPLLLRWWKVRKKYNLSLQELIYTGILKIRETRRQKYLDGNTKN